jgi:hypothetical protein
MQARFVVQDTAAETPNAGAGGFRPYSEHGRALMAISPCTYTCAAFAPTVGGLPHDEEAGAYRVFFGE